MSPSTTRLVGLLKSYSLSQSATSAQPSQPRSCGAHTGRLAQGVMNRAHRCAETEDQRLQDSHSQPHPRFSTFFLRGTDKYRPVIAGTCRPRLAAAVSPRWRGPKPFSRPCGCICAARSFQLAVASVTGAIRCNDYRCDASNHAERAALRTLRIGKRRIKSCPH
jgi:hypothetical protein